MKILITGIRYRFALAVMSSVSKAGYDVIGADSNKWPLGRFSRFCSHFECYTNPQECERKFIDDVIRIATVNNVKYVVPTFTETLVLAKYRAELTNAGVSILSDEYSKIVHVNNKAWVTQEAKKLGIPVPQTWQPISLQAVKNIGATQEFPLILKPLEGKAGEGQQVLQNPAELLLAYTTIIGNNLGKNFILQQFINGVPCGVACLFDKGELQASHAFSVLSTLGLNHSVDRVSDELSSAQIAAHKLLANIRWHGLAEVDFIFDHAKGIAYLLEVNPRFWGSVQNPISAGLDLPKLYIELLVQGAIPCASQSKVGVRSIWLIPYLIAFLQSMVNSKVKRPKLFNPFHRLVFIDEFVNIDLLPLIMEPFLALANLIKTGSIHLDAKARE